VTSKTLDRKAKAIASARMFQLAHPAQVVHRRPGSQGDTPKTDPEREARPAAQSAWGLRYEILGPLTGPNGATAWVRSIWIVPAGGTLPRLVTLIPEKEP